MVSADGDEDPEDIAWAFHPDREGWEALGFDRATAQMISRHIPLGEATTWRAHTDPATIHAWVQVGVTSYHAAWVQSSADVTPASFRSKWSRVIPHDPDEPWDDECPDTPAARWANAEFTPSDASAWWQFTDLDPLRARRWREAGFNPVDASTWARTSLIDHPRVAKKLDERGVTYAQITAVEGKFNPASLASAVAALRREATKG